MYPYVNLLGKFFRESEEYGKAAKRQGREGGGTGRQRRGQKTGAHQAGGLIRDDEQTHPQFP